MDNYDSVATTGSACTGTATTKRGLRLHVKKQLAEDIESSGGIQYFAGSGNKNLYHLVKKVEEDNDNDNPDDHPYGYRGSRTRQQLQQLVCRWIVKDKEGKFVSEILNPWQIVQFSARMPAPASSPRQNNNNSLPSSGSSSDDEASTSVCAKVARNSPPTSRNCSSQ